MGGMILLHAIILQELSHYVIYQQYQLQREFKVTRQLLKRTAAKDDIEGRIDQ